ncbi:VIT family protein [uncultured Alistipes sp.]|uniref:VIT1/CCC1 transporter family protein n=1 Tax=uncultured Alistipes sp. TaxID=538949 RepID=UPI00261A95A8|nr:VIT family protein [uncultured Alistipes sp.]
MKTKHYIGRANWLRAAVLGINDGILSTTSLIIGVAAAGSDRRALLIAGLAGLVAGATAMAAGEFVSVCSQRDVAESDVARQRKALEETPDEPLNELAEMYRRKGLPERLARQVSELLTRHHAADALARETLGINEHVRPSPIQAALASAVAFVIGALFPLGVACVVPMGYAVPVLYVFAIVFLAVSGACAARLGGCLIGKAVLRICFWGTLSMFFTALVGHLVESYGIAGGTI